MVIFTQFMTSFIATAAFGIIFNAPKKTLVKCGFVGAGGWLIYYITNNYSGDSIVATLGATLFVGLVSHVLAKRFRTPVIIYSVAGIIPLVPGGLAYDAMRNFVEKDYNTALAIAAKVTMLSGSIAFGLVFAEVINQVIRKVRFSKKKIS